MYVVPYVGALYPENDIFCNIGGVVCDTLEIPCDQQSIERLADNLGTLIHRFDQLNERIVAHAVDDVIHLKHSLGKLDFALDKRLQRTPDHRAHSSSHACDIDGQIGDGKIDHIHDALGDVDCLIADTLEIGINLRYGKNEAQVHSHRLLHGEQVERSLVDLALGGVDQALAFEHHLAAGQVAFYISLTRAVHGLLRQSSHAKQPLPKIVEPLLKTRTHDANLSIRTCR